MAHARHQLRYVPLDALLENPRVIILRILRHFDWASTWDICEAHGDHRQDTRVAISTMLRRLVANRSVERDDTFAWPRYRITAAGRREYERLLARAIPYEGAGAA